VNGSEALWACEAFRPIYCARVLLHCALTGRPYEATRVLQDTNGYRLNAPIPYRVDHGDLAALRAPRPDSSDTGSRSGTTNIFHSKTAPLDTPPSAGLADALERLRTAIFAKVATV